MCLSLGCVLTRLAAAAAAGFMATHSVKIHSVLEDKHTWLRQRQQLDCVTGAARSWLAAVMAVFDQEVFQVHCRPVWDLLSGAVGLQHQVEIFSRSVWPLWPAGRDCGGGDRVRQESREKNSKLVWFRSEEKTDDQEKRRDQGENGH